MIGAKVSGYSLEVGQYVFVSLTTGVSQARVSALVARANSGLTLEVVTQGGTRILVAPSIVFTSVQDACNHAFSRRAEIEL